MTSFASVIRVLIIGLCALVLPVQVAASQTIQMRDAGRFEGWRSNELVGYGLVVGLAGSGDSQRSVVTRQALQNLLGRFNTTVSEDELSSRNAAVVMVTAKLPPSANVGDQITVTVSSIGDARSLSGGVLLFTELLAAQGEPYAVAQGALVTGGYNFESQLNMQQRNYPTTAVIENGGTVEVPVNANILNADNQLSFLLRDPSFGNAQKIADAVEMRFGIGVAHAVGADEVQIQYYPEFGSLPRFVAELETLTFLPDTFARIVVNERTGTVVAGADIRISDIVISQGDLKVQIEADSFGLQPGFISGQNDGISSLVITNTDLSVDDSSSDIVASFPSATIGDLVQGLREAGVTSRDLISVLQAMRAAGAVHAEIIVQ
ncbi:flagellar basal body P-ring protein FlgI [Ponticaulis sp.]|uniref:flagellar basal body P-ring protein FlgI n=1 Tax=Ponticaulis sp. TaxID=2020902 RepID=UPI000B670315|nr:flagellar basal body P-ring protein FlgI [Ponticaulis sp.]MAJ07476.1 flagellar biosynthesis protein FlgA [Ponticaulis sp.]RPG17708.1 MAG: flagellar basal body P-ring protein FlgI [Hyphomonadaceae bacterium TMED125]HBH91047.1 flagellar biosynthesis protein FlgA [Hyphomonadaceae bacterium]|tara:strand:- start:21336 stop:22466 length:1131 start_codon:yes stop_codon:yes gene_type:complete